MVFRRILLLLALLGASVACTPQNNPPQTAAAAASPPLPDVIAQEVGPTYASPALQALIDRVGRKLVADARIPGNYSFHILDRPQPNAHAMGNNYIFVTRGLLALIDDEAELAAALGHEIGHITLHHATQRARERRQAMDAAVKAAAITGSVTVGRAVARDGLLALRRYSRDQELEADHAGLGYLVKAGYRGDAMVTLIEKLRRESLLQDRMLGPAFASDGHPDAMSTHPAADERLAALATMDLARTPGTSNRAGYLALLDGMSIDDRPEEGFVHGPLFVHPVMKLSFRAPSDFVLFNDPDGVLGVGRDRSMLYFSCTDERVPGRLSDWMRNKLTPTPTDIQETSINGIEAAVGAKPRGADTGLAQLRHVLVRNGAGICFFNLLADGPDRDRRIEALIGAARTFRLLSDAEAAALRPYRVRVIPRGNATPAALAARLPYADFRLERLLALNGVDDAAQFAQRTTVKIIEP
ncbi:MAG: M48 family metalloprotease [Proteobacteria bacterium]|nr:M48 family metalloprotease [Pseudomonadota bacterium]